jgi:pimeloyl-ACP methyl ester carboxylesterase
MRRPTIARTLAVTALATATVLVLGGCIPSFLLPPGASATSTPTQEDVDADLEHFYTQQLIWTDCNDGMQCTTAMAPLDWEEPGRGEIELALVRQPAAGSKIGSLLVNPGGPGASGYDFVADSVDFATDSRLQDRFDVVGFDPRGVGRSSAVACYDAEEMDEYLYGIAENERGTDAWIAEVAQASTAFGQACAENTGELLGEVDTISAARDMDLLRAVLGDDKLNYLGFSYGTFLGATYAGLYPEKVGRLVLDGAIDPSASDFEVTKAQAQGFESALRAYLEDCLAGDECPFDGTAEEGMQTVRALLDSVAESPIRASDGRMLGADTLLTAIIYPLYSADSWPFLSEMLQAVMLGDADYAFFFADSYNGRSEAGEYLDNSTEAFRAINCLDYEYGLSLEQMRTMAAELERAAPIIGTYLSYGDTACATWPHEGDREREPIDATGAAPILVIGTTNDPATPYEWAVSLADQLDSGVLVSYEGEGHTAYNKSNSCINDTVDAFLIDGTVPSEDPRC